MHRLVGKKKPEAPPPSLSDASKTLMDRTDTLDGRIVKLDKELAVFKKQLEQAKTPAAKNAIKSRAMGVLKRKKMLEKQREGVAQQAFNVDQQAFAIDSLKNTVETVSAMKAGHDQMKREFKAVNIGKIEDLQDDMADLMLDAEEVNEVMGRAFGIPDELGEEDLDAELDALGDEFDVGEEEEVPDYLKATDMPAAPTAAPAVAAPAAAAKPSEAKAAVQS